MKRPDIRETILDIVLEMLADHGVDDIHIIIATSLHRRMHDWEVRRMVGDKVYNAYWPDKLYNHDACDPDGMVTLGKTTHGEVVETNKRAADSDLVIYVNINLVPMDGGHKSVGVGLCGYESLKAHHTPKAIVELRLVHGSEEVGAHPLGAPHRARVRRAHEDLPHRDRAQQPRCSTGRCRSS